MDTIDINASCDKREENKGKKKVKFGGKASAAVASGVAGAVVGAAGMEFAEQNTEDLDPVFEPVGASGENDVQDLTAGNEPVADVTDYVNPDDVMLDDDMVAHVSESNVIVDDITGQFDDDIAYYPFTEIDEILVDPVGDIPVDEMLIAQEGGIITPGEVAEVNGLADNDWNDADIDIQSDLMA